MAKKGMQKTTGTAGESAKKKAKPSAGGMEAATATLVAPTREQIAIRARVIWEKRGCPRGQDEQIWLEAEKQLKEEAERS